MLNPIEDRARENEPPELRHLSKSKIHEDLSRQFFLPDKDSRCSTRQYLVNIHVNLVYRVTREELLNFEVGLTLEDRQKSSFFHIGILVRRADRLLTQLGLLPFGFPVGTQAEEDWCARVLRHLDQTNILGGFKRAIRHAQVPRVRAGRI